MVQYLTSHIDAICLLVLLLVSEFLPFSDSVKSNGIFQAVINAAKGPAKNEADKISKE